jgi:ribonuclease PH
MYAICRQLSYLGNQLRMTPIVLCAVSPEETVQLLTSSAVDAITAVSRSATPLSPEKKERVKTHA